MWAGRRLREAGRPDRLESNPLRAGNGSTGHFGAGWLLQEFLRLSP
jgi:hypothetical protein